MLGDVMVYGVGVLLRYWMCRVDVVKDRPEVSTPLNSWKRLTEGVHMYKSGLAPYQGVIYHETPLALLVFSWIQSNYSHWLFITGDILTCVILAKLGKVMAQQRLVEQEAARKTYSKEAQPLLATLAMTLNAHRSMALAFLLNPFIIANCAAMTSTVWTNLLLALFLLALVTRYKVAACLVLSLATYQCLYPALLLVPLILHSTKGLSRDKLGWEIASIVVTFLGGLVVLLVISAEICGDWTFINSTYGFILSVPELTPNMGIFWYFFTEMFDHFRLFFVWTFQLNLMIYLAPLAIRFPTQPILLATVLLGLTAVFKSYPGMGDVGFFLSLLPLFSHLIPFMKQTFIIGGMLIATTVLAPISWQLWIYNNSANANYYFAINLVYSTAQIFLITDLLFAQVKREFYLVKGFSLLEQEDTDGRRPTLQLK